MPEVTRKSCFKGKSMGSSSNGDSNEAFHRFKDQVHEATQKLFHFGVENHELRTNEVYEFTAALNDGRKKAQNDGITLTMDFLSKQDEFRSKTKELLAKIAEKISISAGDANELPKDQMDELSSLEQGFYGKVDDIWYLLMEMEVSLHERAEEAINSFDGTIQGILNGFLEKIHSVFDEIREMDNSFSKSLLDIVRKVDEDGSYKFKEVIPRLESYRVES